MFRNLIRLNSNLQKWNIIEWIFFFIVIPVIFAFIYFIPQNYKGSFFILNPQNLFYPSLFLNAFTHSTPIHLLANLTSYLMAIFLIFNFESNKKYLYNFIVILCIPISIALSIVSMIILPTFTGQGASGIIAGLMGYSVYASYKYFRDVQKIKFNVNFLWLIFLINAISLWYYLPRVVNQLIFWVIFGIIILLILVLFYSQMTGFKQIITRVQKNINDLNLDLKIFDLNSFKTEFNSIVIFIYWVLLVSLLIVVYIGLIILVPTNPWQAGGLTNTIVHYLGFMFGLFAPTIYDFFSPHLKFEV
jgi:hypothetical protein